MYESQRAITYPSIHLFILINLYTSRLFPAGIKDRILAFMKKKKKTLEAREGRPTESCISTRSQRGYFAVNLK